MPKVELLCSLSWSHNTLQVSNIKLCHYAYFTPIQLILSVTLLHSIIHAFTSLLSIGNYTSVSLRYFPVNCRVVPMHCLVSQFLLKNVRNPLWNTHVQGYIQHISASYDHRCPLSLWSVTMTYCEIGSIQLRFESVILPWDHLKPFSMQIHFTRQTKLNNLDSTCYTSLDIAR